MEESLSKRIGVLLLAAGNSKRMGQPKQLLPICGKSLVTRAIESAALSGCSPIVVVVGAYSAQVETEIYRTSSKYPVTIVENASWEKGMGTSICEGMNALLSFAPGLEAVVIMACDQPYVNAPLIKKLVSAYRVTHKTVIASLYSEEFIAGQELVGVPALFDRKFFGDLQELKGNDGAKKLIIENGAELNTIPFPEGKLDVDTPEDYERIRKQMEQQ